MKGKDINIQDVHVGTLLEIDVGSHAACNAKSGSNSRGYRHDELNNQLPGVLFRFGTHSSKIFLKVKHV